MILWRLNTPISVVRGNRAERNAFAQNVSDIELPNTDDANGVVHLLDKSKEVSFYWQESPQDDQYLICICL